MENETCSSARSTGSDCVEEYIYIHNFTYVHFQSSSDRSLASHVVMIV
ncbi:MAG: hypothetical protein ACTS89_01580 [Arsenophonus sp. ER-LPS3-MAG3]